MKEVLIVYNFHEPNPNTDYFVRRGLQESAAIDYLFVINNLNLNSAYYKKKLIEEPFYNYEQTLDKFKNLTVINRANVGHDFGAYSFATFFQGDEGKYLRDNYKYFIFLNSTALGPFLPLYFDKDKHWSSAFIELLNDKVKLVGPTINVHGWKKAHVQSYFLATDRVGLNVGISEGIFTQTPKKIIKKDVIEEKEIGYSRAIIDKGYNISCLLTALRGIDFVDTSKKPEIHGATGADFEWNPCGSENQGKTQG